MRDWMERREREKIGVDKLGLADWSASTIQKIWIIVDNGERKGDRAREIQRSR